jgi:hypothetical protein
VQELPFVSTVTRLPRCSELALCVELWMLLVRRSGEVRRALFGLFGHALGWKPATSTRGSHRASAATAMARVGTAVSTMLSMLRATGLVPARVLESCFALKERFHGLAALSLVFFFTPGTTVCSRTRIRTNHAFSLGVSLSLGQKRAASFHRLRDALWVHDGGGAAPDAPVFDSAAWAPTLANQAHAFLVDRIRDCDGSLPCVGGGYVRPGSNLTCGASVTDRVRNQRVRGLT